MAGSWLLSCASALTHTLLLAQLSCSDNIVPHLFCDLAALLSYPDQTPYSMHWSFTVGFLVLIFPRGLLLSYSSIGVSILMGPSTKGICKDLSTCGYHLSVVSLFYGASTSVCISSSSVHHCFHDVHSGLLHAEHFHLQPEKQRHDIGSGEFFQKQ